MIIRVTQHQPRQRACFLPYIACGRRNRVYPSYRIDRAHYETISNLKRHAFRALRGSGLACTACPAHAANDEFLRDTIPHRTCLQLLRVSRSAHRIIISSSRRRRRYWCKTTHPHVLAFVTFTLVNADWSTSNYDVVRQIQWHFMLCVLLVCH